MRLGDASLLPAVTARDIPERPVACPEKGPRTEYTRAADVRIDYNVIAMINASCAEQKNRAAKAFCVRRRRRKTTTKTDRQNTPNWPTPKEGEPKKGPPAPANRNWDRTSAKRKPHPAPNQTKRQKKQETWSSQRANWPWHRSQCILYLCARISTARALQVNSLAGRLYHFLLRLSHVS